MRPACLRWGGAWRAVPPPPRNTLSSDRGIRLEGGGGFRAADGVALVTADHGNAEVMLESDGISPQTAHTTNPVPLVTTAQGVSLRHGGGLSDLAPTILDVLEFPIPEEMTGFSLTTEP